MNQNFKIGFQSLKTETIIQNLEYTGKPLPDYLNGSFLRNGPSLFELEEEKFNHLFDGLAMIHSFQFNDGQISYRNKFLKSNDYKKCISRGKVSFTEFGTAPKRNFFEKISSSLFPPSQFAGNASINFMKFKENWTAIFDVPTPVSFDLKTLNTINEESYNDFHFFVINSPHPIYDFEKEEYINFGVEILPFLNSYKIFKINKKEGSREVIATIPVEKPAYMHSFAMSEKYIILTEHPLLVNEIDMLTMGFRDTAIIDSFNWTPSNGTRIIIVERESGKTIHEIKTDTFFTFHHLNAFDDGDDLIVDIAIYDDWSIIDELYMNTLKSDKGALTQTSIPYRFKIDIKTGTLEKSKIVDEKIELPVINFFKNSGKKYSFVYGVGNNKNLPPDFLNQLIKIDVETKEIKYWNPKNHYPQEPFFVPKPNGKEDEGVVLSVVADGEKGKSFLLILDAESFTEIGRAYLPHVVPFGLHGIFVPK